MTFRGEVLPVEWRVADVIKHLIAALNKPPAIAEFTTLGPYRLSKFDGRFYRGDAEIAKFPRGKSVLMLGCQMAHEGMIVPHEMVRRVLYHDANNAPTSNVLGVLWHGIKKRLAAVAPDLELTSHFDYGRRIRLIVPMANQANHLTQEGKPDRTLYSAEDRHPLTDAPCRIPINPMENVVKKMSVTFQVEYTLASPLDAPKQNLAAAAHARVLADGSSAAAFKAFAEEALHGTGITIESVTVKADAPKHHD